jgi:hypothetical protein
MTDAPPHPNGQFIKRIKVPGSRLAYDDELVPYGVYLMVIYSRSGLTELDVPNAHPVCVFNRELAEPGFVRLHRTATERERQLALRRVIRRPAVGQPLAPEKGQWFSRTGRPLGTTADHYLPHDRQFEVTGASDQYVDCEDPRALTDHLLSRRFFTDAYVKLVPAPTRT